MNKIKEFDLPFCPIDIRIVLLSVRSKCKKILEI